MSKKNVGVGPCQLIRIGELTIGDWWISDCGKSKWCKVTSNEIGSEFIESKLVTRFSLDNLRIQEKYTPTPEEELAMLPFTT